MPPQSIPEVFGRHVVAITVVGLYFAAEVKCWPCGQCQIVCRAIVHAEQSLPAAYFNESFFLNRTVVCQAIVLAVRIHARPQGEIVCKGISCLKVGVAEMEEEASSLTVGSVVVDVAKKRQNPGADTVDKPGQTKAHLPTLRNLVDQPKSAAPAERVLHFLFKRRGGENPSEPGPVVGDFSLQIGAQVQSMQRGPGIVLPVAERKVLFVAPTEAVYVVGKIEYSVPGAKSPRVYAHFSLIVVERCLGDEISVEAQSQRRGGGFFLLNTVFVRALLVLGILGKCRAGQDKNEKQGEQVCKFRNTTAW